MPRGTSGAEHARKGREKVQIYTGRACLLCSRLEKGFSVAGAEGAKEKVIEKESQK